MRSIYILTLFSLAIIGCEETIIIDPQQVEPVTVIEGLITDETRNHYVRVTETVDFYQQGGPTAITTATVTVQDNAGNFYNYQHNPNNLPELEGYYFSQSAFSGVIGNTYTLNVNYEGQSFEATDQLFPVTDIDSLEVVVNEDELNDPEKPGYFYEVLFYAKEPQETKDYYLFKFYRNDSIVLDSENDIYFSNDDAIAEEINGIPTAGFYKSGDTAKVEMYSISKAGFIYYNDLINLLNSDGGMFGPPPVNPRNNISNGAMGYFQTSAKVSETIVVE